MTDEILKIDVQAKTEESFHIVGTPLKEDHATIEDLFTFDAENQRDG